MDDAARTTGGPRSTRCATLDGAPRPVGGPGAQDRDLTEAIYAAFPLMLALIAVITFVLLTWALRSVLLPVKAILLNVLSVGAAFGIVVLVWQQGYGSELIGGVPATGAITNWVPAGDLRLPLRPVDGLRGVHPQPACARSTSAPATPTRPSSAGSGAPAAW